MCVCASIMDHIWFFVNSLFFCLSLSLSHSNSLFLFLVPNKHSHFLDQINTEFIYRNALTHFISNSAYLHFILCIGWLFGFFCCYSTHPPLFLVRYLIIPSLLFFPECSIEFSSNKRWWWRWWFGFSMAYASNSTDTSVFTLHD